MRQASVRQATPAYALLGAVVLNLLILYWLAREPKAGGWSDEAVEGPPVALSLSPPPSVSLPSAAAPSPAKPRRLGPPDRSVQPPRGAPHPIQAAPFAGQAAPPAGQAAPFPGGRTAGAHAGVAPPPATGDEDAAKTRATLRRLHVCADFARRDGAGANCGAEWGDSGARVEPLTAAQKAGFATTTPDDRIRDGAKVRDALINHDSHGSHINYGCTWTGEKMTCSTY